ncbi:hypothetical protein J6590_102180 [Homalodisca vitripennis]|nr:hypothetical protein J6590_102180 [Homalodisca vitripennis]
MTIDAFCKELPVSVKAERIYKNKTWSDILVSWSVQHCTIHNSLTDIQTLMKVFWQYVIHTAIRMSKLLIERSEKLELVTYLHLHPRKKATDIGVKSANDS